MKRNKLVLVALVLSSGLMAAPEASVEGEVASPSFKFTNSTHVLMTSRQDTEVAENPSKNLFNHENLIRGEYGAFQGNIDFTTQLPLTPQTTSPSSIKLEKKVIGGEWRDLDAYLGDTHQELSRGIALSLYRDDTFGIDNTLEGANLRLHPGKWQANLFGGRINALQLPVALNPAPNPLLNRQVYLAGGNGKVRVVQDVNVGAHYFVALNQPSGATRFDHTWQTVGSSFSWENIFDQIDFNLEANLLFNQLDVGGVNTKLANGRGNYASLTWQPPSWKVRLEGKNYVADNFDFRRPPTLEEDVVETTNLSDVTGGRLFVEKNLEGTQTFINASYFTAWDVLSQDPVYHYVAGSRFKPVTGVDVEIRGGYRWMPGQNNLSHALLTTKFRTGKRESLELGYRKLKQNEKLNVLPILDDRNIFAVTYNFTDDISVTGGYEYLPSNDTPDQKQNFFNVSGRIKYGPLTTRAFIGQTSGGTQCSGGICRVVPPYTGALVDTILVF